MMRVVARWRIAFLARTCIKPRRINSKNKIGLKGNDKRSGANPAPIRLFLTVKAEWCEI